MPTAFVVGAGPVGCLTALGLSQRGYKVILFEARPESAFSGANLQTNARSINLAISTRGLTALSYVNEEITQKILQNAVPMKARMLHSNVVKKKKEEEEEEEEEEKKKKRDQTASSSSSVKLESQLYSDRGYCINSVSRNLLNRILLDEVIKEGIEIKWSHRLLRTNLAPGQQSQQQKSTGSSGGESSSSSSSSSSSALPARDDQVEVFFAAMIIREGADSKKEEVRLVADLIVGCDGHHSKVREQLSRAIEMDFNQRYIDNYYTELHIPVNKEGEYALDPNHLHIWPRHDFMLIALANQDKTFTSTLFAPKRIYSDHLQEEGKLLQFFQDQFPDALEMIGKDRLVKDLLQRRPSSLGTIECNPYHDPEGKMIILGDAAHAMVPFYGQGLNCGLEDVRIMLELLDQHCRYVPDEDRDREKGSSSSAFVVVDRFTNKLRSKAFSEYTRLRHPDLVAISQLALSNFEEMSSKVVSTPYRLRKQLDSLLVRSLPDNWWNSLYSLVTFSNIGYHQAQEREMRQRTILNAFGLTSLVGFSLTTALLGFRLARIASAR